MEAIEILANQVADEIQDVKRLLVRDQKPMIDPVILHPNMPCEWVSYILHNRRLGYTDGTLGRQLNEEDMQELMALIQPDEEAYWAAFARRYGLLETHMNTDPRVLCLPAAGAGNLDQIGAFEQKFMWRNP